MCGRFTHMYKWRDLHRLLSLTSAPPAEELPLHYNVAPSQSAPVVRADTRAESAGGGNAGAGRRLDFLRWGLVPFWAKDAKTGYKLINARAETVATAPAFRAPFKARRCVVPVSGFYEWRRLEGRKSSQPYYIRSAGEEPLLLAGLWEKWRSPAGGEALETFTIVTTPSNEVVAQLHDRMPAILDPADVNKWLDPSASDDELAALLRPYPSELLLAHRVSTLVNSPKNDVPECVAPVEEQRPAPSLWTRPPDREN